MEEALHGVLEMKNELAEKEKVLDAETAKTDDALKLVSIYLTVYDCCPSHSFFPCQFLHAYVFSTNFYVINSWYAPLPS